MNYDFLSVSDGTGDAAVMTITADRVAGATTISVNTVAKVPAKFIGTWGTVGSNGLLTPSTIRNFRGHVSGSSLIIDAMEAGSTDAGNATGQVVIVKPSTGWANRVANFIKNATGFGTPEAVQFSSILVGGRAVENFCPAGAVMDFAGSVAPTGWLICDGSAVSRSTYATLFSAVGTTWGIGDGSTTFNLPDTRGRARIGVGTATGAAGATAHALAQLIGEEKHTMTVGELVAHTHPTDGSNRAIISGGGGPAASITTGGGSYVSNVMTTGGTGSTTPFNVMQPSVTMNAIIKT